MGDGPWRGCSAAPTCWLAGRCGGCGNALLGLAPWQVGRGVPFTAVRKEVGAPIAGFLVPRLVLIIPSDSELPGDGDGPCMKAAVEVAVVAG